MQLNLAILSLNQIFKKAIIDGIEYPFWQLKKQFNSDIFYKAMYIKL